jgi:dihydroflavonol-4-reductase
LILDFCRGRLPAVLDCTLNLIDVRDVAVGLDLVMERGRPGRRYLLGNENVTLFGLLNRLSTLTGVPVPRWRVPYPVGLAVAALSELWADAVTGRTPKATLTGLRLARRILHFDSSVSRAEIGLQPRSLAESLADAVSWLRGSGYLTVPIRRSDSNRWPTRPN